MRTDALSGRPPPRELRGQIGLRLVRVNLSWPDEAARFLMLWISILGASLATRARSHITIDILARAFSPRGRARAAIAVGGVGAALCAWLCAVGVHYVAVEMRSGYASKGLGLPFWAVKAIIPVGLLLISFRFVRGVVEDAVALRDGDLARFSPHPPPEVEGRAVPS